MKKLVFSVLVVASSAMGFAQQELINGGPVNVVSGDIIDGVYIKEHIPTKRLVPYEFVREADVIWSKRVWRRIDLREKINHPLYLPADEILYANQPEQEWIKNTTRWSLFTVMKHHIMNGDLTLFSPWNPNDINEPPSILDGDLFKYPIRPKTGMNYYTDSAFQKELNKRYFSGGYNTRIENKLNAAGDGDSTVTMTDPGTGEQYEQVVTDTIREFKWIVSQHIVAYDLKEDWFFDKERSVMDVRILGICPVIYYEPPVNTLKDGGNNNNEGKGSLKQMFWLYFPHCRFVFNNYFAYNTKNDAQWASFDDLFWKRQFSSYIYKESNVFDRKIESFRTGVDALHESNKISEEIRTIEHDVWHF